MRYLPIALALSGALFAGTYNDRPIYPYSVIPGGIYSNKDLSPACLRGGLYYLQYSMGGEIGWTFTPRVIKSGEPVMIDIHGDILRSRCGNGMSKKPQLPHVKFTPPPEHEYPIPVLVIEDIQPPEVNGHIPLTWTFDLPGYPPDTPEKPLPAKLPPVLIGQSPRPSDIPVTWQPYGPPVFVPPFGPYYYNHEHPVIITAVPEPSTAVLVSFVIFLVFCLIVIWKK